MMIRLRSNPGNNVSKGDVVAEYLPSFTFFVDLESGTILEDPSLNHRYLWLVFAQNGRLEAPHFPPLCSAEGLAARGTVVRRTRKTPWLLLPSKLLPDLVRPRGFVRPRPPGGGELPPEQVQRGDHQEVHLPGNEV